VEYFFGSVFTLVCFLVLRLALAHQNKKTVMVKINQSYLYRLMSDIAMDELARSLKPKQSDKYLEKDMTKVMIVENKAYWIKNNQLFVAQVEDGKIDNYSAQQVDTMAMDSVELERTMFVVEKLTEDKE
jgi:hypothetical protein